MLSNGQRSAYQGTGGARNRVPCRIVDMDSHLLSTCVLGVLDCLVNFAPLGKA